MKSEPWLLVPEGALAEEADLALGPEEARHASGALRLEKGDRVTVTDGAGFVAGATLTRCRRSDVVVLIDRTVSRVAPLPGPTIALGVLHTKAMDWAVQKAVEVGAAALVPMLCERSQGSRQRALERGDHLRRVALQALKQCRRAWAMPVEDPLTIDEVISGRLKPGLIAAHEGLTDVARVPCDRAILLVGPEGGLTSEEQRGLEGVGWSTIALGPHILRAETAAVVGAAVMTMKMQGGR